MFLRLIITFLIATLFTTNSRAMEANLLAQLDNAEARASYCFYAFSINIQLASKGADRMKVLPLLKPYKAWDNVIKEKFPDKNTRNDELTKAALQFEIDVGSSVESNNLSKPVAQQFLIDSISEDCKAEFEKFKNYTPTKKIVQAKQNSQTKKLASTSAKNSKQKKPENYPDSPFHKGIFNPGWKGDISWFDSDTKERLLLISFDNLPEYSKQWQIHANARSSGSIPKNHCIGHLVEFDLSPDGLTLYMKPSKEGGCGGASRVVSINAVAADDIRFEVRENEKVIAAGNLWSHNHRKRLVLKTKQPSVVQISRDNNQVTERAKAEKSQSLPVKPVKTKAIITKQAVVEIPKKVKSPKISTKLNSSHQINKQSGTVTKTDEFWVHLGYNGVVQEVFEGDFSELQHTSFKVYFHSLQTAFSNKCKDALPENAIRRGYISQTVHSDGFREAPVEHFVFIAPRFIRKFDEYESSVNSQEIARIKRKSSQMTQEIMRGKNIFKVFGQSLNNDPAVQLMRFIDKTGCNSAAVYQLRENFLRAAYGRPSLQQDNIVIKNAAKESIVSTEKTIYGACMGMSYTESRYCLCFERNAKRVMTDKELKHFSEDFNRYYTDVQSVIENTRVPASGRLWDLYQIFKDCAN